MAKTSGGRADPEIPIPLNDCFITIVGHGGRPMCWRKV